MGINLSEWVKNMKMFMFHMNSHHMVTTTEEDFNNQVDRMTHCTVTCQLLSPATLVITQWARE